MIYAGFWKRFLAYLIDLVILIVPGLILSFFIPVAGFVVVGFLYHPIFNASFLMGTPGKAIMGLAVVDEKGNQLTLQNSFIRYACTFISAMFLCIGYIMNLFTSKRQTLHDLAVSSVVILKTAPELNYFDVWLAEIKKIGGDAKASQDITKSATDLNATKAIEDLHKLFQSGAITQSEFENKKTELLKKI